MYKIIYMIKRILGMNYKEFFQDIGVMHRQSGKSQIALFFDVIWCGLRYGCGRADYRLFEFWRLSAKQRATFLTRAKNNWIVRTYNQPGWRCVLEDKVQFNQFYHDLLGRKWIDLRTAALPEFSEFMQGLDAIIAKPLAKSGGTGIEKLHRADYASDAELLAYLQSHDFGLAEECLVQVPELAEYNSYSVNTYRICTILIDGTPHVLYFYVRVGSGHRVVDNLHSGGITCPVDPQTGRIKYPGYSAYLGERRTYTEHPETHHKFVGEQLPMTQEAIALAFTAARRLPQVAYVGWDIAITPNGPALIEGNPFPGHDLLQLPPHAPDGIGVLPEFREIIPDL